MAQWISPTLGGLVVMRSGLENLIDNVYANITGGSGKFYDDYPIILGSSRGIRCAQATSNLLWAINPDATSFEGNTTGAWTANNNCVVAVDASNPWHGIRCLKQTWAAAGWNGIDVTAVTAASTQYTAAAMVRGAPGKTVRLNFYDSGGGDQPGTTITLSDNWQFATNTKTFGIGANRFVQLRGLTVAAGDISYLDAIMLNAGAVPLPFVEKEALATNVTVPTPFAAGEDVSILLFLWTPWAGDDSANHWIFSAGDANPNRFRLYKDAGNRLYLSANTESGSAVLSAATWPAGTAKVIALSRSGANYMVSLNGNLVISQSANVVEGSLNANFYMGTSTAVGAPLNGTMLAAVYPGVAFTAEECKAASSLKTWMSPGRDGYMRHMGALDHPRDCLQGVDHLVR